MRNRTETDYMITCNHERADGQFDSDVSVPAGAVHSERLSEGKKIYVLLYNIAFITDGTGRMMSALMYYFCFMHRSNIMHVCSDASLHLKMF